MPDTRTVARRGCHFTRFSVYRVSIRVSTMEIQQDAKVDYTR